VKQMEAKERGSKEKQESLEPSESKKTFR